MSSPQPFRFGVQATRAASGQEWFDLARRVEDLGYSTLFLTDHYLGRGPAARECNLPAQHFAPISAMAAAAAVTTTLRIGCRVFAVDFHMPVALAKEIATIDVLSGGRVELGIGAGGQGPEYRALGLDFKPGKERVDKLEEVVALIKAHWSGEPIDQHGEHVDLTVEPPRVRTVSGGPPLFYFGGLSEHAREVAAAAADVYLMWPDTMPAVAATVEDLRARAERHGRRLRFGYRVHVIVRETESDARAAAARLVSRLDDEEGRRIRERSLDSASAGVRRQAELREAAGDEGYVEDHLWTGVGRARSGCGAAIVGDPDQVLAKLLAYRDLGIDTFILSGYPHREECELFSRYVLPHLDHAPLRFPNGAPAA